MSKYSKNNKEKKSSAISLSEEDLSTVGGGYDIVNIPEDSYDSVDIARATVYRGIDANGGIFYTTDKSLVENLDTSKNEKIKTPFNMDLARKARTATGVVYED